MKSDYRLTSVKAEKTMKEERKRNKERNRRDGKKEGGGKVRKVTFLVCLRTAHHLGLELRRE